MKKYTGVTFVASTYTVVQALSHIVKQALAHFIARKALVRALSAVHTKSRRAVSPMPLSHLCNDKSRTKLAVFGQIWLDPVRWSRRRQNQRQLVLTARHNRS